MSHPLTLRLRTSQLIGLLAFLFIARPFFLQAQENRDQQVASQQDTLTLTLRSQQPTSNGDFTAITDQQTWKGNETAIIVCDVWDAHHCLNAVRRIEEFAPRLNDVLTEARSLGATIIHSPSDCMEAYRQHPARRRAKSASSGQSAPAAIAYWCSMIPAEEKAIYPIDQSDGGEDDDPAEHRQWQTKLESMGRNPATPWLRQTPMLKIDAERDYISDRGEEVWQILQQNEIENVILVGVHTNMCVLGRPFGLRQMVRHDMNVVLMRDMTDSMYNPKRWPYVSHYEGNRRVIAHVERCVCPTVTSDQILGGEPFQFEHDTIGDEPFLQAVSPPSRSDQHWSLIRLPVTESKTSKPSQPEKVWYRCVVRVPSQWLSDRQTDAILLRDIPEPSDVWINGQRAKKSEAGFSIGSGSIVADDYNTVVFRAEQPPREAPRLAIGAESLSLAGRWQTRLGDDPQFAEMPLPAKFGGSADIVFDPNLRSAE